MTPPLHILFLSSEVVPFSKTGGLADVAGALPGALAELGCDVTVVSPWYSRCVPGDCPATRALAAAGTIRIGSQSFPVKVRTPVEPKGPVRHLFIENEAFFGRAGLYGDPGGDNYADNDLRYVLFCRAALDWARRSGMCPDIIHLNDWQTAPVAAIFAEGLLHGAFFASVRTVLTVHNLAYQGVFPPERFALLGFREAALRPLSPFEFWGKVNFLKAGLVYAHKITTVSPTYAREIRTDEELGCGLGGVLRDRRRDVSGILNGIDTTVWNPAVDRWITTRYTEKTAAEGKRANKEALCAHAGFPRNRWDRPLVGIISRLAGQKGFDLIAESAGRLFSLDCNLVLLGTGERRYHDLFTRLEGRYGDRLKAFLTFDNALAHRIEAGADLFLMPSRYEPCGLNQMYSLNYGTVPVVRATGGLADTVIDADRDPEEGNGFVFERYSADAMLDALARAVKAFAQTGRWTAIRRRGMLVDFSWKQSAARYIDLYREALPVDVAAPIDHH